MNMGCVIRDIRIAVLITCHNRKEKTLACLDALAKQEDIADVTVSVYLVDDGCTDGTGEAVRCNYPKVKVLQGDGSLYWCGGMRLAFAEAMKGDYHYYLWLNDDTILFLGALRTLLETSRKLGEREGRAAIVTGSTCDPKTKELTYGGVVRKSRWHPFQFLQVMPSDEPRPCDTINGNCVLIPRQVSCTVGILSPDFTHGAGDFDYGLRARAKGFSCWVAPGFVGTCSRNSAQGSCKDLTLSVRERLRKMTSPTGPPPMREWMVFTRRHGGVLWPIYWLRTLIRVFFPRLWLKLRSQPVE